jgi:hypothetical protein
MPVRLRTNAPKRREVEVSEKAVQLFTMMRQYRRNNNRWWDLHNQLFDEVHAKL